MKDPLESKRKPCEYFIPRKYAVPKQFKISDHAVEQYTKRFGNGNGSVRGIIKSVIDNGEVVKERDENNRVIRHNNVYCIVKNGVLATVYLEKMYHERCAKIEESWGNKENSGGEI